MLRPWGFFCKSLGTSKEDKTSTQLGFTVNLRPQKQFYMLKPKCEILQHKFIQQRISGALQSLHLHECPYHYPRPSRGMQAQVETSHSTRSDSRLGLWLLRLCPLPGAQLGSVVTHLSHPQIFPQAMTVCQWLLRMWWEWKLQEHVQQRPSVSYLPTYILVCLLVCASQVLGYQFQCNYACDTNLTKEGSYLTTHFKL